MCIMTYIYTYCNNNNLLIKALTKYEVFKSVEYGFIAVFSEMSYQCFTPALFNNNVIYNIHCDNNAYYDTYICVLTLKMQLGT